MRASSLFLAIALMGCSSSENSANPYFWVDSRVVDKLHHASVEMPSLRPKLEFSDGSTASNCQQYFQQKGKLAENTANFSARSHYLICDALKISESFPVKYQGDKLDTEFSLCTKVNLASFKHSLRPRIATTKATLSQLFGGDAVEGANTCTFEGEKRNFVLHAVLLVKEQDKPKKLWIWVTDEILDASYRSYTPIWFAFDESQNLWIAKE